MARQGLEAAAEAAQQDLATSERALALLKEAAKQRERRLGFIRCRNMIIISSGR